MTLRRSKAPPGRFPTQQWMRDRVETAARPRQQVEFTFTDADTEYRVRHHLPHAPQGYNVVSQDREGSVYRDEATTRADRFYLYLKSSVAGLIVTLEVF